MLGSGPLSAQKNKKKNDVEIIEFGNSGSAGNSNTNNYSDYILKSSPTSYLAGSQFVELEKYMTDYLSLQAGLGLTFKPLIGASYDEIIDAITDESSSNCDSDNWAEDICDDYVDTEYRRYKMGVLLSGSARLFFDSDAMDGGYFGFKLRYSTLNLEVQDILPNMSIIERTEDSWVSEKVKRFDVVGHYGYQSVYSKLTAEYFLGLGARFRTETRQDLGRNQSSIVQSNLRTFKASGIRVEAGIRIGFQL